MSKSYCMKCKKEVDENVTKCECNSVSFVYGDDFHFEDKDVVCDCGSKNFKSSIHMDYSDRGVNNYICSSCSNPIGVETYRKPEDAFLWGEE